MLSSGCDDRECRVLLHEGVRIGKRTTYPLRKSGWSCSAAIPPGCLTSGTHLLRIFRIRRLTPDGRGEHFNFPSQTYPDPLVALTRRVSQPFCTVPRCSPEASRYVRLTFWDIFLKLPDICDRHFEIFCFRYLMSKSPNSPCNPPIIGFLSY